MGQLIAKLMGIFGNQGKGRTARSSDSFDPAPTWGSPNLGSGRMRWGTSGSEGPAWALLSGSAVSPVPSHNPSPPAPREGRASVHPGAQGSASLRPPG